MEIIEMKNKIKIVFEYPKKLLGFGTITKEDLSRLYLAVFLKDGNEIPVEDIESITYKPRSAELHRNKSGGKQ